jgi:hypothetical protein
MTENDNAPEASAAGGSSASGGGRSWLATILMGLGVFLIVAGALAMFYLPGQLEKAPIDTDEVTNLDGTGLLPANFADPTNLAQVNVQVFKPTKADQGASDADVVVYDTSQCLVVDDGNLPGCVTSDDPAGRLVSIITDRFATDRVTGLAVNDPQYVGPDAVPHEGLVNKFPFNVEKKTYPMWDGIVGEAVDATYEGTDTINGLDVYLFKTSIDASNVEVLDGIEGTYKDEATYYVEPKTGAIQNKVEHQERYIGEDQLFLQLDVKFTDEQIKETVDSTESSIQLLNIATLYFPIAAYILGVVLIVIAVLIARRRAARA